jgi:hypothetical protein
MSEAQFQKRITDYCDLLGLKWHHETDSRKSKKGFPDLVIAGRGGVIFAELKAQKGRVTNAQADWIGAVLLGGGRAYVWRPSDWPEVEQILRELAGR